MRVIQCLQKKLEVQDESGIAFSRFYRTGSFVSFLAGDMYSGRTDRSTSGAGFVVVAEGQPASGRRLDDGGRDQDVCGGPDRDSALAWANQVQQETGDRGRA